MIPLNTFKKQQFEVNVGQLATQSHTVYSVPLLSFVRQSEVLDGSVVKVSGLRNTKCTFHDSEVGGSNTGQIKVEV